MSRLSDTLSFGAIRALTWPFSLLPYRSLHTLGKWLGSISYTCCPKFRKRALSNLSLASTLKLSQKDIISIAKGSMQNMMITCLEYTKLAREKDISRIAYCENPDEAASLLNHGKGIIFFCGHQANWEILFLEGTSRMPGVAIGRPTNNKLLYRWVVSIREKFGGTIIEPRNAVRESLRALKKRCFLGIVGDQGMPQGGFASDFLGRRAYTSPLPAILAYRTGAPLLVATVRRHEGRYAIRYSAPLYADPAQEMDHEVERLMREALGLLGTSIQENPDQWLWAHNRWKQQVAGSVKRPYRFDCIRVILPQEEKQLEALIPHIATLRAIYPTEHFTVSVPQGIQGLQGLQGLQGTDHLPEVFFRPYSTTEELFECDFASKVVFNFTGLTRLSRHYRKLAAVQILTLADLWKIADLPPDSLDVSDLFYKVLRYAR